MKAKQFAVNFYLDYINNYITLDRAAEHHEISLDLAEYLTREGKEALEELKPRKTIDALRKAKKDDDFDTMITIIDRIFNPEKIPNSDIFVTDPSRFRRYLLGYVNKLLQFHDELEKEYKA